MHAEMRSEMAQEFHREMENMRQNDEPTRMWDVVAVDSNGNRQFVTESEWTEEEARQTADNINAMGSSTYPDNIVTYEAVHRSEHDL